MNAPHSNQHRADVFRYVKLDVAGSTLHATYELDGRTFEETVTFDGVAALDAPGVASLAQLWFLLAGLSYYKTGAARHIDVGDVALGPHARALLQSSLVEGLAEFAYRNDLSLEDVVISGGNAATSDEPVLNASRVLVPFGGGIDSVVTTERLAPSLDQALFIVSPSLGRFKPLEATAGVTMKDVVRAQRSLDQQLLSNDPSFFHGHVPVTAMVTLLAAIAAIASGRGGVVMSNEHSASSPNVRWHGLDVNHQWSKSWNAEQLIANAVGERIGSDFVVASFLRDRSELWVGEAFSHMAHYHHVFRSCNRSFTQVVEQRLDTWCGECDKCLFINLMLAPFLSRATLREIFHHEPLSDPAREAQLRVLVGAGLSYKPFECVGDPTESAVALARVSEMPEWADVELLSALANEVRPDRTFEGLLVSQGPSRVPAHWLR